MRNRTKSWLNFIHLLIFNVKGSLTHKSLYLDIYFCMRKSLYKGLC